MTSETSTLLSDFCFIDLSSRLPGPYGAWRLGQYGARIIRIEDINSPDPFSAVDGPFFQWYQNLNRHKEILKLNFSDQNDLKTLQQKVQSCDGVITSLSDKRLKLLKLTKEDLQEHAGLVMIKIVKQQAMHDMNALAQKKLLISHVQSLVHQQQSLPRWLAPPFLPLAGIELGNQVCQQMLAVKLQNANKKKSYQEVHLDILASTELGLSAFISDRAHSVALHNGLYPCYQIYFSKDRSAWALAAIEAPYFENFCQGFELPLTLTDRFKSDHKIFTTISEKFLALSDQEIQQRAKQADMCLELIGSL